MSLNWLEQLRTVALIAEANLVKQIVSYHSGLGTGDLPLQKAIYGELLKPPSLFGFPQAALLMCLPLQFTGGIGWGLDIDVVQIYDFISNNYQPGDELFFFGFSRGAFTVRSVANPRLRCRCPLGSAHVALRRDVGGVPCEYRR